MVTGFIDDVGHPKVELTVVGKRGEITLEEVDIILTEADDSLVGTGLLQGRVVTLDFQRKRVEISEKG